MGAHSENIVLFFPSMGEENRHDGVLLLNEHGGLCVLLMDFGIQIIPLNQKNNDQRISGKKDRAISEHEARYSRMQIMTLKART